MRTTYSFPLRFAGVLALVLLHVSLAACDNSADPDKHVYYYYDSTGALIISELATHYRDGKLDSITGKFVGKVTEYDMNGKKIASLLYDKSGTLVSGVLYSKGGQRIKGVENFPDSVLSILENKSKLVQSQYIRLADYGRYKFIINSEKDHSDEIFTIVEDAPKFEGGLEYLLPLLWDHLIVYPETTENVDPKARVYISCVIQPNGEITQVKISEGKGVNSATNDALNNAILEGFKKLPDFIPGRQRGHNVAVSFIIPIQYRLDPKKATGQ